MNNILVAVLGIALGYLLAESLSIDHKIKELEARQIEVRNTCEKLYENNKE